MAEAVLYTSSSNAEIQSDLLSAVLAATAPVPFFTSLEAMADGVDPDWKDKPVAVFKVTIEKIGVASADSGFTVQYN